MIFDQQVIMSDAVTSLPDWSFSALPKQPTVIMETTLLTGIPSVTISLTGISDNPE